MRRLWTPRWILVHVAAVVLVIGFLWLGWWQVQRAAGGNLLSFGYAIEWPVFAGFVIFVWLKEMRRALSDPARAPETAHELDTAHEVDTAHELDTAQDLETAATESDTLANGPPETGTTQASPQGTTGTVESTARNGGAAPRPMRAGTAEARRRAQRSSAAYDDSDDEELAAYNRYLAWLNAHPHASPSDYPG